MIKYELFFRRFVTRRQGDLAKISNVDDIPGLSIGSILHLNDNMFGYSEEPRFVTDVDNPLYSKAPVKKYVYPNTSFRCDSDVPVIAPTKGIRLIPIGIRPKLIETRAERAPNLILSANLDTLPNRRNAQSIIDYNALYRSKVTGIRGDFRIFNCAFATMLNNAASMIEREHYIHIPVTHNSLYSRADFAKAFKDQSRVAIKYPENASYLFLVNLLSFIESKSKSSMFENIPLELLPKLHFILTCNNKCIVYRLDILRTLNKDNNVILQRIISQLNSLLIGHVLQDGEVTETPVEEHAGVKLTTVDTKTKYGNTTGVHKPTTTDQMKSITEDAIVEFDEQARQLVENTPEISVYQKDRVLQIAKKYKSIEVHGQPIESLLMEAADQDIDINVDTELTDQVMDQSMLQSKINDFTKSYMEKMFTKDIVAGLTSFTSQGMFLVDYKEKDVSDELSHVIEYTAKFQDIKGESHTIKFTLPKVDRYGNCLVNGSLKSIRMQRVNTPICKVSPTRVALNTNFNKALVERNVAKAHCFYTRVKEMLAKSKEQWSVTYESNVYPDIPLPYDYSALARHIGTLTTAAFTWTFKYNERFFDVKEDIRSDLLILENEYGVYLGSGGLKNELVYFINVEGILTIFDIKQRVVDQNTTIIDYLTPVLNVSRKLFSEWVEIKGLKGVSKKFPVIFMLCYRFGLSEMLKYMDVKYTLHDVADRVATQSTDILLKFKDQKMVMKGTPRQISLLFSGLTDYDFSEIYMEELDQKDIYFDLIQQKKLPVYYLKNIDVVFEMFIDPITRDILAQMGEPTNMRDLLIRCVTLLSTEDHRPAASESNYRYRSAEIMTAIVYRKLSAALATHQQGSYSSSKKFSISSYEIMSEVMSDALVRNVDTLNPIADIKDKCGFSHVGEGGRSSEAFVVDDRKFPDDAVGIMSEATVDSGKVAIDAMLTMDPNIINTRGLTISKEHKDVKPTEMFSVTGALVPGIDQDDSKRANFVNIQAGQYVPTKESQICRYRTGYERVLAHRTRPPFAYVAENDGIVTDINERVGVMTIEYKDGSIYVLNYGPEYTKNGGGGFYVTQNVTINDYEVGKKFKKGDVLLYNADFFSPDPYSKQVDMKLGHHANLVLMEHSETVEDSCLLSKDLSESLSIYPVHVRQVIIKTSTNVHQIVTQGTEVKSVDPLMVFDDSEIPLEQVRNPDMLEALQKLNRSIPKCKYDGVIVKVEAFYRTPINEMRSESIRTILKSVTRVKNAKAKIANMANNADEYPPEAPLKRDRFGIIDLDEDTVILQFYIQKKLTMEGGDKVVFASSLKSVCARVFNEDEKMMSVPENSEPEQVHAVLACLSMMNRMVLSVFIIGSMNRILEKMEKDILDIYFDK